MFMDAFAIKIIAMILMVFDHVGSNFSGMPMWFNFIGRVVSPIFFYFIVEGFFHTKSKIKYMGRLFGSALIMQIIGVVFHIHNNIFLSLALAVLLMYVIDYTKNSKKYILGIICSLAVIIASFFSEASIFGVGMTLIFYFLRDKKFIMSVAYILFSLCVTGVFSTIGSGNAYEQLILFDPQWMMVFSIIFILLYNGKRGINNKFTKYLFYIFYPLHLVIIKIISMFI
ncbi:TraX family protein [Clostridium sp. CTA-19]